MPWLSQDITKYPDHYKFSFACVGINCQLVGPSHTSEIDGHCILGLPLLCTSNLTQQLDDM